MSGLMGAIGRGLGRMGGAVADLYAKRIFAEEEEQRQQRLLEFRAKVDEASEGRKLKMADDLRQQRAERITSKAGEMLEQENEGLMTAKKSRVEAGIVDREAWTPEQQAAVDQSMQIDREALKGRTPDGLMLTRAAAATGDIGPEKLAELERKGSADIYKAMWEQAKEEGRNARSDARLEYLMSRLGGGKDDAVKNVMSYLDNARKELQSEELNLRQLYLANIKDKSKKQIAEIDKEYKPKFDSIQGRREMIEEDFEHLRERVGLPSRGSKTSTPPPKAKEPQKALPLPKSKEELKAGEWYDTARGRARWNGTAFEK